MKPNAEPLVEQMRPFLRDEDAYGRLCADVHDLKEICAWFLKVADSVKGEPLSRDALETLLIELDVRLVDHGVFHLNSLKKEIAAALEKLGDNDVQGKTRRGAA